MSGKYDTSLCYVRILILLSGSLEFTAMAIPIDETSGNLSWCYTTSCKLICKLARTVAPIMDRHLCCEASDGLKFLM